VQWIVLVSAVLLCRLRTLLSQFPLVQSAVISYVLVLAVTAVLSLAGQAILWFIVAGGVRGPFRPDYWQLAENLLITAILSGIVLRYFYLQQQLHDRQQGELEARIQALQSRIRPHFLFNSMNSIASLIATDPDTAERVVEDLSELYRASLAEPALTSLQREITLCQQYLGIEQLRLGARLQVAWNIEVDPESEQIPGLLLQPLLENAVFHGIEPRPGGGCIAIDITRKRNRLVVSVSNPIAFTRGAARGNDKHNRMAMTNIRHRLQAHFGHSARLQTVLDSDTYTTLISWPANTPAA